MWIVLGFLALIAGGELLVRGASGIAAIARICPLAIGLTVVAFGTSAPELAVSMQAGLAGKPDLVVGNVVGSNILNVLLILGVSAAIAPLAVSNQLVRRDVPLMIVASIMLWFLSLDGSVSRIEGASFVGTLLFYTGWSLFAAKHADERRQPDNAPVGIEIRSVIWNAAIVAMGLAFLGFGSNWLVSGATDIARRFGVGELVIGLTIVAAGTSLPELVTSIVATVRGQRDIAVGNVIGSNLFNILCVLGGTAAVSSGGIQISPATLRFDLPVMVAVAVACLPIFFTGRRVDRWEGLLFVGYFCAYTVYVLLAATNSNVTPRFQMLMWIAVPLTIVTLVVGVVRTMASGDDRSKL